MPYQGTFTRILNASSFLFKLQEDSDLLLPFRVSKQKVFQRLEEKEYEKNERYEELTILIVKLNFIKERKKDIYGAYQR